MRIGNDPTSSQDDDQALDRLLTEARWPAADEAAFSRLRTTLAGASIRASAGHSHWWSVGLAASIVTALIGGALLVRRGWTPRQLVHKPSPPPSIVAAVRHIRPGKSLGRSLGRSLAGRRMNSRSRCCYRIRQGTSMRRRSFCAAAVAKATVKATGNATAKATGKATGKTRPEDLRGSSNLWKTRRCARHPSPCWQRRFRPSSSFKSPSTRARKPTCATRSSRVAEARRLLRNGWLSATGRELADRRSGAGCFARLDHPPIGALIEQLHAPLVDRRLAAARALGCLCHGPTFAVLQRMVERDISRREAMIALLYCPNPAAKEYLDQLRTRPVLGQELQAVKCQMQILSQPNI